MKFLNEIDGARLVKQDSNNRFVTDAEKSDWDSKASGNHNHSTLYEPKNTNIQSHISNKSNPHNVSKAQVGLGSVDNTSDLAKPISTATQTALNEKVDNSRVLTDVPLNAKFTDTNTTYSEITTAEIDAGTASTLRTITGRRVKYILDKVGTMISTAISGLTKANVGLGNVDNVQQASKSEFNTHNSDNTKHITSTERTNWNSAKTHADTAHAPSNAQKNGDITKAEIEAKLTGTIGTHSHTVTKANVGLGNVDNTSDVNKPVSTATKNAIDLNSVPFVAGTQTATTASWTGVLDTLDDIYDGLTIRYWLPRTSASSVTLNLTLKGGTTTGAIPCYYSNSSRLSTHYATGNIIVLTYVEGKLANGVSRTGWYAHAQYNTTYSIISETEIDTGTSTTGRIITAQRLKYITDKIQTLLNGKVDNSQVLTNVPANAKFTDTNTVTTINGKTGAISKADIVALGVPSSKSATWGELKGV